MKVRCLHGLSEHEIFLESVFWLDYVNMFYNDWEDVKRGTEAIAYIEGFLDGFYQRKKAEDLPEVRPSFFGDLIPPTDAPDGLGEGFDDLDDFYRNGGDFDDDDDDDFNY